MSDQMSSDLVRRLDELAAERARLWERRESTAQLAGAAREHARDVGATSPTNVEVEAPSDPCSAVQETGAELDRAVASLRAEHDRIRSTERALQEARDRKRKRRNAIAIAALVAVLAFVVLLMGVL